MAREDKITTNAIYFWTQEARQVILSAKAANSEYIFWVTDCCTNGIVACHGLPRFFGARFKVPNYMEQKKNITRAA